MSTAKVDDSARLEELLFQLTLEEKASLCSGADFWNLKSIERLGIPSLMVTDGPHGLRKQTAKADNVGLNQSVPATCFPTASALASSWNLPLLQSLGAALAEECIQEKVGVILGPGANIKRSPLCGRNFEYFSEDPYLSGKLAAAQIDGIQSRGIAASLKHFAVNNQETRRLTIDALVDQRAFREIYLAGFEEAVVLSQPSTVMCAYNRINGEYCSENHNLLTGILKNEWGHEGLVVTDWGAVNNRVKGLAAGLELEMPGSGGLNDTAIVEAVESGSLSIDILDSAVKRILKLVLHSSRALKNSYSYNYNPETHRNLAYRSALESSVLLKNEGILPLRESQTVAVVGEFADSPRYQGSGSSKVNPWKLESALDALRKRIPSDAIIRYAPGYQCSTDIPDEQLSKEAIEIARDSDVVLVFAGLTERYESEAFDRTTLDLPENHNALIHALSKVNRNIVVVLSNGAPVLMPWLNSVKAVLECYLGGQASGAAAVSLLYGDANPSGKLAETFPLALSDVPSTPNFPGGTAATVYAESIFVGYRYFDTAACPVLFPFGFGLSYTTFEYDSLQIGDLDENGELSLSCVIRNTGSVPGAEVVQLYLKDCESTVFRPEKELKGFSKIFLQPGSSAMVDFSLNRRSFAFWDTGSSDWVVEEGDFEILVGSSSADIRLSTTVFYPSDDRLSAWAENLKDLVPGYYRPSLQTFSSADNSCEFSRLYGKNLPPLDLVPGRPYSRTSVLGDVRSTRIGALLYFGVESSIRYSIGRKEYKALGPMANAMVEDMPLRNLSTMSNGALSLPMLDALLQMINGKFFKGVFEMFRAMGSSRRKRRALSA